MKKNIKKNLIYVMSTVFVYFSFFKMALATDYSLLEPLPVVGDKVTNFGTYLSNMFELAIGVAAVLAVFMLAYGGFKYITSEALFEKEGGRDKIKNAIYGLLLILSAYLLLQTINPDLVEKQYDIPKVTPVGIGVVGSATEEDLKLPSSQTDCISTITGQSIPCTPSEIQQSGGNNRPLGNFESYGYTKTKVDTFTDKYEKDNDVVCLNTFSGLEVDCP